MKDKSISRSISLFMCMFCILMFWIFPLEVRAQTIIVNTAALNIRSGPAVTYAKIGQAKLGQQYTVQEENNGWVKIKLANGITGWIIKDYVSLILKELVINEKIVNIRSGPGTSYSKIISLPKGTKVTAIDLKDGWYQIQWPKGKGWVANWLVTSVPGQTEETPNISASTIKPKQCEVTVSLLNVRSGPGINTDKLCTVSLGTRLNIIDQSGDWYRVSLNDGRTGWVSGSMTKLIQELEESENPLSIAENGGNNDHQDNTEGQLIKWSWEKAGSGVKIVIQGTQPLGYTEKIVAGDAKIMLEFDGSWKEEPGTDDINYGGISTITREKGDHGILFQVGLNGDIPYHTELSPDGCNLVIYTGSSENSNKTVVIDPGHGSIYSGKGYDPGAIGATGLRESDVVLDIGKRVEKLLTDQGIKVLMTRSGDTNLSLEDRANIANQANADAFVSIHANASVSSTLNGTSTYFYAPSGSNLEGQRAVRKKLAESIQNQLLAVLGRKNLGVREENFAVLRCTSVPSVLVETAFISNNEEEILLADEQFREQAAQAIAQGIMEFLE